jgi:hypothetical protein
VAGATRLGLHFGVLHLQHAQILNPSTLNPSNFNSQSGSNLLGSCPKPSPCLVGGTGSLGAHRPEPRSMPYAIVVGSRTQPRGCLQGLQPSRHPHVHLNPPVLHWMATTFSVTPAQLKKKEHQPWPSGPPPQSSGWFACGGTKARARTRSLEGPHATSADRPLARRTRARRRSGRRPPAAPAPARSPGARAPAAAAPAADRPPPRCTPLVLFFTLSLYTLGKMRPMRAKREVKVIVRECGLAHPA